MNWKKLFNGCFFAATVISLIGFIWASGTMAQLSGGSLAPTTIPKYVTPLVIPPAMPETSLKPWWLEKFVDYYEIAVRQFEQQILPAPIPPTTVWSYGPAGDVGPDNTGLHVSQGGRYFYPAFTIEAKNNRPSVVKWVNELKDGNGNFRPHLLPIDRTLHWANPEMLTCMDGMAMTDCRPDPSNGAILQEPYTGPVPIITHLHGGHTFQENDGYPEAWYLPDANNIPAGYDATGTYFDIFKKSSFLGKFWEPGSAVFLYTNDQRATTLWYHDHSLGMTRANVYAGPAGFYLLRGGLDDLNLGYNRPSETLGVGVTPGKIITEIPIVIQDRSFNQDGSLFYPDSRTFFDGFTGPYIPSSDISPIWNPEFFGNTIVTNGQTWPFLNVEPRRYRLRFLNGCNSRFLWLKFNDPNVKVHQIGADGGFLPAPVDMNALNLDGSGDGTAQLLMALAERADVIVDFSKIPVGTEITLLNIGPDEPFGGGIPGIDFLPSDPGTTGQVMKFNVVARTSKDTTTPANKLRLPRFRPLRPATNVRQVSLNEESSAVVCVDEITGEIVDCASPGAVPFGPREALLGTLNPDGTPSPKLWMDPITENPRLGATEIWEIVNFTMDAHPIHIHVVQFEVVNREIWDPMVGTPGTIIPREPWETGTKDTVIAYPGQITRVKAIFDIPGRFVWHCHILEHEDNEMMRPYCIGGKCQ